ncbi:MAG: hypothetical protein M3Q52_04950 [Pseudomonadota bacterium]|nr:hypothetical protein [Pseudomonadota bacterium]
MIESSSILALSELSFVRRRLRQAVSASGGGRPRKSFLADWDFFDRAA